MKFAQMKSQFVNDLVDILVYKEMEFGYNDDGTKFMSFFRFSMGYQAGKHYYEVLKEEFITLDYQPEINCIGIPHAPKLQRTPIW